MSELLAAHRGNLAVIVGDDLAVDGRTSQTPSHVAWNEFCCSCHKPINKLNHKQMLARKPTRHWQNAVSVVRTEYQPDRRHVLPSSDTNALVNAIITYLFRLLGLGCGKNIN